MVMRGSAKLIREYGSCHCDQVCECYKKGYEDGKAVVLREWDKWVAAQRELGRFKG